MGDWVCGARPKFIDNVMQGQRNIDLLLLLLLNFFGLHVHSQVIGLDCNGVNNTFRANGTDAFISCNVTSSSIAWSLSTGNSIVFIPFLHSPGDEVTSGAFKATYLQETPPGMSTLEFVFTPSLNGTNVTCADVNSNIGSKICYLLVISKLRKAMIIFIIIQQVPPAAIRPINYTYYTSVSYVTMESS